VSNAPADRASRSRRGRLTGPGVGLGTGPGAGPGDTALTVVTCVMLALFAMAQALVGTFFYGAGPAPVASIGFGLAILATCLLGGWGLGRPLGGVVPALGWFIVAFVLATGTRGGSVLIAATSAGEWFLFGGAACATAGMVGAMTIWSRRGLGRMRR
jgi:hypothetical protein